MKFTQRFAALAGACAVLLTACGTAPMNATPDALLGRMDQVLRGAQHTGSLTLQVSPNEVRTGQALGLQVTTSVSGYLYVYQIATDGKSVNLIFPNAMDGANYLNQSTQLPRPNWTMVARGPQGIGYFVAVATEQPQDLMAQGAFVRERQIRINGAYAAAMVQFRELP